MPELRFRPFVASDLPALAHAFAAAFHVPRSLEQWRHCMLDTEACGMLAFAADDPTPLAFYGATVREASWCGQSIKVGQIVDVFSHPKAREAYPAVFVHNAQAFYAQFCGAGAIQMLYGYPSKGPWRQGERALQYQRLQAPLWLQCLSDGRLGSQGLSMAGQVVKLVDLQLTALPQHKALCFADSSAYRQWRYPLSDSRYLGYGLHGIGEARRLGELVFRLKGDTAYLLRWQLPDQALSGGFWLRVTRQLANRGVARIQLMLAQQHPELARLADLGFAGIAPVLPLIPCFRVFDAQLDTTALQSAFYYSLADTDLY
ncbi:hypothetical protein [Chitinimonas sp.]|uniref:hypothetical protein n=1 Tax=Chitinimonas sp. TaxID=1934313 RepID=UPI0035B1C320